VPDDVLQMLEREAEERSISVNSLVIGILSRYAEWGRFAEKIGQISVPASHYKILLNEASPETFARITEQMSEHLLDMSQFMLGSSDFPSLVRYLELIGKYSGLGSLEKKDLDGTVQVQFYHQMGARFSEYLGRAIESCLKRIGFQKVPVEWRENMVAFQVAFAKDSTTLPRHEYFFAALGRQLKVP